jgi:hypothetical protein
MIAFSAQANASQTNPGDGVSIASIGSDDTFVSLNMRRLGAVIELVAELTIFHPVSGGCDVEEVGRTIADDEDDAVNAAIDLQRAAHRRLGELDVTGIYSDPDDFGEALEAHFDRANARADHAIAAE